MAATSRISSSFHPEHLLARCNYSEASTQPCAACERVVTGTGYRCVECNFNIHEPCLSLPHRVALDRHPGGHVLALSRLGGASRRCHLCKETSGAGRYMYLCTASACNYGVHPRCTSFVARPPALLQQAQQQQQGERWRRGGKTRTVIMGHGRRLRLQGGGLFTDQCVNVARNRRR